MTITQTIANYIEETIPKTKTKTQDGPKIDIHLEIETKNPYVLVIHLGTLTNTQSGVMEYWNHMDTTLLNCNDPQFLQRLRNEIISTIEHHHSLMDNYMKSLANTPMGPDTPTISSNFSTIANI